MTVKNRLCPYDMYIKCIQYHIKVNLCIYVFQGIQNSLDCLCTMEFMLLLLESNIYIYIYIYTYKCVYS